MDKETFNNLIEIQSCSKKINEFDQKINSEYNRLEVVKNNIDRNLETILEKEKLIVAKKSESEDLEKEITHLQKLIERTNNNLAQAKTNEQANAAQKELDLLGPKVEQAENNYFEILEIVESIEHELAETISFKDGSKKTIEKLSAEIEQINLNFNQEKEKYIDRKNELLKILPKNMAEIFLTIEKKKSPAITFMENKRCTSCMTLLDNTLINQINAIHELCHCSTCGRILVSPEVRY